MRNKKVRYKKRNVVLPQLCPSFVRSVQQLPVDDSPSAVYSGARHSLSYRRCPPGNVGRLGQVQLRLGQVRLRLGQICKELDSKNAAGCQVIGSPVTSWIRRGLSKRIGLLGYRLGWLGHRLGWLGHWLGWLVIRSQARLVRSKARLVRSLARLVRSLARLVRSQGRLVRSQARLARSLARLVRSQARLISSFAMLGLFGWLDQGLGHRPVYDNVHPHINIII